MSALTPDVARAKIEELQARAAHDRLCRLFRVPQRRWVRNRGAAVATAAVLAATTVAEPASGVPGDLDPSFGTGGTAVVDLGGSERAYAIATQPDGAVLVAGVTDAAGSQDAMVFRLRPDGELDETFGPRVLSAPGTGAELAAAVAVQPDGKVLVAGQTSIGTDGLVWRLLPSGRPDPTFGGGDGVVAVDSGRREILHDVAVAPGGAIVVVGRSSDSVTSLAAVYRLTPTGLPDKTFDQDGVIGIGGSGSYANAVALQPNGGVLVSGHFGGTDGRGLRVRRLEADGAQDLAFGGGDGEAAADDLAGTGEDLVVQPDGRIVVTGYAQRDNHAVGAFVRYTASGLVDRTFGDGDPISDGTVLAVPGRDVVLVSLARLPDGAFAATGFVSEGAQIRAVVVRVRPDGALDTAYASGGYADLPAPSAYPSQLDVGPDGKVVVASTSVSQPLNALVHRLLTAPDPTPTGQGTGGTPPQPTPTCHGRPATLVGTPGKDRLTGTPGRDVVVARGGSDRIRTRGGDDLVCAGDGADHVDGGAGRDRLYGERGEDRLTGGPGRDRLVGGPDRDRTTQRS